MAGRFPSKPGVPEVREPRRLNLRDLLGDDNEVQIIYDDVAYRLRITSNGKLILTK